MIYRLPTLALERIVVHIGFHKCGSTAIQMGLTELSDRLLRKGVYFPHGDHALVGSFFAGSRRTFFHNEAFGRIDHARTAREDHAYLDGIWSQASASQCHTLILSYEGFPNLSEQEVAHLVEMFSANAKRVDAVVYCRHPLSFAPSEISQRARSGVSTDVICSEPPILEFKTYLPKFVKAFGIENVIARDFDFSSLFSGDVFHDFLSLLPECASFISDAPRNKPTQTVALSQEAVLIARALRSLWDSELPISRFAQNKTIQTLLSSLSGSPIRLSIDEKNFLMQESVEHLEYLEKTFDLILKEPKTEILRDPQQALDDQFVKSLAWALMPLIETADRCSTAEGKESEDI